MLTRWLIPIVLFAAAGAAVLRTDPLRGRHQEIRDCVHPQFRRRAVGLAARKHRSRSRLVRLQQRRLSGPVRGFRQAARRRAYTRTRYANRPQTRASQSPLPQQRRRHIHRRHRSRPASRGDLYSMAAIAADYDNDGNVDLLVTGYGRVILYRNKGDGTFEDVTAKAGLNVPGWSIGAAWLDYDRDGCVDLFVGRYVKFDPEYRCLLRRRQLSRPARLRARNQRPVSQQLRRHLHRRQRQIRHRRIQGPRHGRHRRRFRPRRLPRYLRRQRQDRELPLPQPARRNLPGDRTRRRRGLRTERREHFRHGTRVRRFR